VISIVDYGAGNLRSVANTLDAIGATHEVIGDPQAVRRAAKLILPGVGHFGPMMRALDERDVRGALIEAVRSGTPFLGICLGLQALFASSDEAPAERGLGILEGEVRRFEGDVRIPHMGWNRLSPLRESRLFRGVDPSSYVYFAHSYYAPLVPETAAACDYRVRFTAVIERDNVTAVQFHPEKSGDVGLAIMRAFAES
jgi:imidazole glycerol phosphate synthase glutamine amidotransferase subunit